MHRKPESRVRTGAYRALVWRITLIGSFAPHHAAAQMPPVGFIDVYGARRHPVDQIRQASGLRVGDAVTRSTMSAAKMRLKALPGVHEVWVDANCCLADAGQHDIRIQHCCEQAIGNGIAGNCSILID